MLSLVRVQRSAVDRAVGLALATITTDRAANRTSGAAGADTRLAEAIAADVVAPRPAVVARGGEVASTKVPIVGFLGVEVGAAGAGKLAAGVGASWASGCAPPVEEDG